MLIRKAEDKDIESYIEMVTKLSKFNRINHPEECKYDEYEKILDSIRRRANETFINRGKDIHILIVECDSKQVGYALAKIYNEDSGADNGTGRMGLFDELYLDEDARGFGIGQKLLDEVINWFKSKGISRIKLHAYSWNENAKKLYNKNGFLEYAISYEKFI